MKPIPLLCITHYNRPDLTLRCLKSIDYPVDNLLLFNNGPVEFNMHGLDYDGVGEALGQAKKLHRFITPRLGCGPAANMAMKCFPLPWWLFSGNDIQFQPGDLQKMADAVWANHESCAAMVGNLEAALMAITWRGLNRVGFLDENFYPCYMEDFDWFYRCKIAGENIGQAQGVNALHGHRGECSSTVESDPACKKANEKSYAVNCAYYRTKWGGDWQKEIFVTPYNAPNAPASYWKFIPELRKQQIWES